VSSTALNDIAPLLEAHPFCGIHILGEMSGIASHKLADTDAVIASLKRGIELSGATLCNLQVKLFTPSGLTVLALLAESHASIHTYPEEGALFFDVFTCGDTCVPERVIEELVQYFAPAAQNIQRLLRGLPRE
jgi:S-adenosylmethionine decarboxylase